MCMERLLMFLGGVYIGLGNIMLGGGLMLGSVMSHFLEYEFYYRMMQNLMEEQHGK